MRALFAVGITLAVAVTCQASNLSLGKTATANTNYNGGCGEVFPSPALTDGLFNDTATGNPCPNGWSFWLGGNGTGSSAVVNIDLGQDYSIDEIDIQTTHNRGFNDRGTTLFSLYIGTAPVVFGNSGTYGTQVLNSQSLTWTACCAAIPVDTLSISPTVGRYVTLTSLAALNNNAGLNEITVLGGAATSVPEPASFVFVAIALVSTRFLCRRG